jgi:hypothetical protein
LDCSGLPDKFRREDTMPFARVIVAYHIPDVPGRHERGIESICAEVVRGISLDRIHGRWRIKVRFVSCGLVWREGADAT